MLVLEAVPRGIEEEACKMVNWYLATSNPALGPIPVGTFVWMTFLAFAIILIIVEKESKGPPSIIKRTLAFGFATMTFALGNNPQDYVIEYQNGTLASQTTSLISSGAGASGIAIFVFDAAIMVLSMLLIIELLVAVLNRGKLAE